MTDTLKNSIPVIALKALKGLPTDLKDLFLPRNMEELLQFEKNLLKFISRATEREKVMKLQRKYGIPLRPNMSMSRTLVFVKLAILRKHKNDPLPSETSEDGASSDQQ